MTEPNRPEVKILAVSNVYTRLMHFKKKGDFELGHYHTYDHGTLLSSGKLLVEMFDKENNLVGAKEFTAPSFIMVKKNNTHKLTALEDNTIAGCIHALRTIDDEIVDPEFIIEETELADDIRVTPHLPRIADVYKDKGIEFVPLTKMKSDE
jgi:hypothetical protein